MVTVKNMLERWKRVNVESAAEQAVDETVDEMLDFNLEQLMEGKRRDGKDITPSYLDDPYFKSRESAQRYSDWKDEITPNSKRKKGTPNLYINGKFHRSVKASRRGRSVIFQSDFPEASKVEGKFKEIYGLNSDKRVLYVGKYLRPELMKIIRNKIKS